MKKRKPLPLRWAKKLLKQQGGVCAVVGCGVVLVLGPRGQHTNFIDEHIVPRAIGGKDTLKNRELRCIPHAKEKTTHKRGHHTTIDSDIHAIGKVRRIRRGKMTVVKRRKSAPQRKYEWAKRLYGKLRGRPFSKVKRPMRNS